MARDNDKGLYLPLRIDLDEWERDLLAAGDDITKAMRKMSEATGNLKLNYSVEIEGAKAAGDYLKVIQLETARNNQLLEVQTRVVDALTKKYESYGDKGSKAAKDVEKQLLAQRKVLYQLQQEQNKLGLGLGAKISDALAKASPEFARFRAGVQSVSKEVAGLAGSTATALTVLKGFSIAGITAFAAYKGLSVVTNNVNELSKAAAQANEPIYQLREVINSTYEDAEELYGVFRLDGGDVNAFVAQLNLMQASLKLGDKETNMMAETLKRYGVQLRNANGDQKSVKEQLRELADGYQRAKAMGKDRDFLSGLRLGNNQFTHVLADLDGYISRWKATRIEMKKSYDESHAIIEAQNALAESKRNLNAAKGELYVKQGLENIKLEIDANKALQVIYQENAQSMEKIAQAEKKISEFSTDMKSTAILLWEDFKLAIYEAGEELYNVIKGSELFMKVLNAWAKVSPAAKAVQLAIEKMGDTYKKATEQRRKMTELRRAEEERLKQNKPTVDLTKTVDTKKENEEIERAKKTAEAVKKFNEALFNATSTEYEKQLKRITDEKDAYIAAGVSKVDAERLFAIQKAQIDKQYYDKASAEQAKLSKQVQDDYKRQVEEAKKAREAAMSEAEQTLKNNIKLVRYMDKIRKQGGDYVTAGQQYAEKQYFKQAGFNRNDIGLLKDFGVNLVKEIANVRDRVFADFAQGAGTTNNNVTNNTTVNIDRPVLTDENLVNQLTGKILDRIAPLFQQPVSNNTL